MDICENNTLFKSYETMVGDGFILNMLISLVIIIMTFHRAIIKSVIVALLVAVQQFTQCLIQYNTHTNQEFTFFSTRTLPSRAVLFYNRLTITRLVISTRQIIHYHSCMLGTLVVPLIAHWVPNFQIRVSCSRGLPVDHVTGLTRSKAKHT